MSQHEDMPKLFLVDNAPLGFWRSWNLAAFEERFEVVPRPRATARGVHDEIQESVYVITDNYMGTNPTAGQELLAALWQDGRLRRGIVYSGEPGEESGDILLSVVWPVTRDDGVGNMEQLLLEFLLHGRRAAELECDKYVECLTNAIHALENVALPIRVDLDTLLNAKNTEPETRREIWTAHFEPGNGYLSQGRQFPAPDGAEGSVQGVARVVAHYLRRKSSGVSASRLVSDYLPASASDATVALISRVSDEAASHDDLCEALGITEARIQVGKTPTDDVQRLSGALSCVVKALGDMTEVLRRTRSELARKRQQQAVGGCENGEDTDC